jgi:threonine/homoserine/homoserine lactone efflux protein
MTGILLLGALAGLGLEFHPGSGLRRVVRAGRERGAAAALLVRLGGILAVAGVFGLFLLLALLLPRSALESPVLSVAAPLVAAGALVAAGWRRIEATSRLDLRRDRLDGDEEAGEEGPPRVLEVALEELRRPRWHAFWWCVVPGVVLVAYRISPVGALLLVLIHALAALGWTTVLTSRLRRERSKVCATWLFRLLHSMGGLALVGVALVLLASALGASGLEETVRELLLRPLYGPMAVET